MFIPLPPPPPTTTFFHQPPFEFLDEGVRGPGREIENYTTLWFVIDLGTPLSSLQVYEYNTITKFNFEFF